MKITVMTEPIGKPRMTQRDRWKKRPCVLRYHAFKDAVRKALLAELPFNKVPTDPQGVNIAAYFSMPKSWPKRKKESLSGAPHKQKPDIDNIIKAVLDTIFPEDSLIYCVMAEKYWDDGRGTRLEIEIR